MLDTRGHLPCEKGHPFAANPLPWHRIAYPAERTRRRAVQLLLAGCTTGIHGIDEKRGREINPLSPRKDDVDSTG